MVVRHNSWALRVRTGDDDPFMRRCFEITHGAVLEGLPEPLRGTLMAQQRFAFERFVEGTLGVLDRVVVWAGVPVGRVIESRVGAEWWLVDLAFLAEARGQGLGSAVLEGILAEARDASACVRLHVRLEHRAVAWYVRHGFVEVGRNEQDLEMRAV